MQVEVAGKTYPGSYTYNPPNVRVSSIYGDDFMRATQANQEAWAKHLLRQLVERWLSENSN